MMGPWLIFATLLNRAAMAIYQRGPTGAGFGKFVQDAGVTMLGVVPSLVPPGVRAAACTAWTGRGSAPSAPPASAPTRRTCST